MGKSAQGRTLWPPGEYSVLSGLADFPAPVHRRCETLSVFDEVSNRVAVRYRQRRQQMSALNGKIGRIIDLRNAPCIGHAECCLLFRIWDTSSR